MLCILTLFQTQINVICRKTGERKFIFHAEAFFYLHIINQYEKDGYIFLDVCAYRDPAMLDCMYIENLKVTFTIKIVSYNKKNRIVVHAKNTRVCENV